MRSASLEELCEIHVGRTPARAEPSFWGAGEPWLSIADMNQGRVITTTKEQITAAGARSGKQVEQGTILLSFKLSIGKVATAGIPLYTNEAIAALPIRDRSVLDEHYLLRALAAMDLSGGANRAAMGATLNKAKLRSIRIPLPSLPEQRRIAAILDHADALRTKRRQVLAHLDALTQSIFHDMFSDPAHNLQAFPTSTLGQLALKFRDGPFGSNLKSEHYKCDGIPVVRLQNIGVGKFLGADRTFVSAEHYSSLRKHDCQPGDVLIATLGSPNLRACVQPESIPLALNKADCVQMRVDPTLAVSEWVCALLNMPGTLAMANSLILGQTRSRISMGRLRELQVPVPPLSLQKRFAERVEAVLTSHRQQEVALQNANSLFASLQARAFKGEL